MGDFKIAPVKPLARSEGVAACEFISRASASGLFLVGGYFKSVLVRVDF
jgi:hypothetical protein